MSKAKIALAMGVLFIGVASSYATGTWYYTEASFLAHIQTPFYLEDTFSSTYITPDGSTFVSPTVNGYSWEASSVGVASLGGALQAEFRTDPIDWIFTGSKQPTAFGGYFFNTANSGTVTLSLNGATESAFVTNPTNTTFLGWVGDTVLTDANLSTTGNTFVAADHVYTANAVPEPFTMSLGLASAGLFVRRRLSAKKA